MDRRDRTPPLGRALLSASERRAVERLAPGTAPGSRPCILAGLVGADIGLSRTPAMQEREAEAQGLRLCYRLFDTARQPLDSDGPGRLLDCLARAGFRGVNVTHPFKVAVVRHLDELSPAAAAIGSVNTVVFEDGRRIGYNTDAPGFAAALRAGFGDVAGARVVLLGAGGAGRAVAFALLGLGIAELRLVDVDRTRVGALADRLAAGTSGRLRVADGPADALVGADMLVNATPIGTIGHPGVPLDPSLLRPGLAVVDIVYVPRRTELLRAADERGCRTLDGSGMAVHQAAEAFRLFTGLVADPARMARVFEELEPLATPAAADGRS